MMSTPQIPNLTTLRRGAPRLRGRGRGDFTTAHGPSRLKINKDEIIQQTDFDAASSRISAVEAGYLDDPFAKHLSSSENVVRRLPLMNRAIDRIVDTFISSATTRAQIISLGAGSDTRFFRLRQRDRSVDILYHEFDFPTNSTAKIRRLLDPSFAELLTQSCDLDLTSDDAVISTARDSLSSKNYHIHSIDLRDLVPPNSVATTTLQSIDPTLCTLIISECCLCYLPPTLADGVLDYITNLFPLTTPLSIVIYEPIRPQDAFGRTMTRNLAERGIELGTVEKYGDLPEQENRLRRFGFASGGAAKAGESTTRDGQRGGGAKAWDIDTVWKKWVSKEEKERVEGLEWMDEVEEFVLLAKHYCLSWGWRGFPHDEAWRTLTK